MKTIRRTSLQSEIIESIRSYIGENNLREGDRLPSQEEMTGIMGVSRTSLREALKTLEAHRVIRVVNGKGIYVGPSPGQAADGSVAAEREREMLLDAIEMRRHLDREMIRLVVKYATEEDFNRVQEDLDRLMRKHEGGGDESREDYDFHMSLYRITHNNALEQVYAHMGRMFRRLWEYPLGMERPFQNTIPLHGEMFAALRRRHRAEAEKISERAMDMMAREVREA